MNEQEAIEAEVVADGAERASAEPIDGGATAKKPRGKRVPRNWVAMRKAWIAGHSVQDIAEAHNCPRQTVYDKASRCGWPARNSVSKPIPADKQVEIVRPGVQRAVEPAIHEQVTQLTPLISAEIRRELADWFKGVVGTSKAIKEHIDYSLNRAHGRVEVEEIKSLSLSLASIDTTVRRTFGLDSPDGRNLGVLASCRASVECPFEPAPQAVAAVPSGDSGGQAASGGAS